MQTKSYGFQRQSLRPQPAAAAATATSQQQQSTTTAANTAPKQPAMALLPNGIPPPPQHYSYPPPPPIPNLGTPDLDLFAFHNLYQPIIESNIYCESRIDMEHSLSKALLSDIQGSEIEPELYADMTNTGVIHQDKVKLTQKVKVKEENPKAKVDNQSGKTSEIELILNPLDQTIDRTKLFQPMSHGLKRKATFHQEGFLHKIDHNAIQTRPKRPTPYIAPNIHAGEYQDGIQHAAKKAAR